MESRFRKFLILTLLFLLLSFGSCAENISERIDFEKGLVFFEQWVHIAGEPGSPYLCIDFPTYRLNREEGTLVSFVGTFGRGEGKIDPETVNLIVGEGVSLSGRAGTGASSGLKGVTSFPFTVNYRMLVIKGMEEDGSLRIERLNDQLLFFEFSFPNPLPSGVLVLKPGERLTYSTTQNVSLGGERQKLTLTVTLESLFLERAKCQNAAARQ